MRGVRSRISWTAVSIIMCLALATSATAESEGAYEDSDKHESASEEHGEEHEFHKHHVAAVIGATESVEEHGEDHGEGSSDGKDDPNFTIAFDYERRFTQLFGFGGMADWVLEGRREFLIGPIAFLHPFAGSKFYAGPLAEGVRETGDWQLVVRVGAAWDFEIGKGKYSISPNVNYDITEEHRLWVVGVAFGMGF